MRILVLLIAASFLALSQPVHARCVGEEIQVTVLVTSAGDSVPGAAIKVAWVSDGMDSEFFYGSADDIGRFTFILRRPVASRSRWPAGYSCSERVADLEVCASDGARDERCSLLHRPEATIIPVEIDLQGGEASNFAFQRKTPAGAGVSAELGC